MKKVYTAVSLVDAHLLKGLLEVAGIGAEVRGEQAFQITGQVPARLTAPTVWVMNDGDFEKAEELVSSFREGETRSPDAIISWRCICGEVNEGRFTECWSCGRHGPGFEKGET